MRLLDVSTYTLHTFYGDDIPPYAILSHTWLRDDEEVTFADIQSLQDLGETIALGQDVITRSGLDFPGTDKRRQWRTKPGVIKIQYLCDQAAKDGYAYAWIDTCCIDKTNTTELSEAINSMFDWYFNSGVCYAYLADVVEATHGDFLASRWWTRAWTLQELLASTRVEFYNTYWNYIGSKVTWAAEISCSTGIDEDTLHTPQKMFFKSIAQRMSWAAGRKAKRSEDRAYSLLGIFEISMAMQYGEGPRAFMRLQEEILKGNNDQTLFAWSFVPATIQRHFKIAIGESLMTDLRLRTRVDGLAILPARRRTLLKTAGDG
jgi:hypothetical protein